MRMRRVYVEISEHALRQLAEIAERERRDSRQQAAYMLEQAVKEAIAEPAILDMKKSDAGYVLADAGIAL